MKRICLGLFALSAMAQSPSELEQALATTSTVTVKVGGRANSDKGSDYLGRLTWNASEALTLFVAGDQSILASTSQSPTPSGNPTTTTTTTIGGAYLFGRLDLGLQYDHANMSELLRSNRYSVQPTLEVGAWRFGLDLSTRKSDFDRIQFKGRVINTPTGPVAVSGYADLFVKDTGLGASLDWSGETWRCFGSYNHYQYGAFEGTTDVTRIRNATGAVSPEVFKILASRFVDRFMRVSASTLSREASLLDSETSLGLEANLRHTKWGLEFNHDTDHLTGAVSETGKGTAGWKATPTLTLEVQLGATHSDVLGTNRFVGLNLIFRTQPTL